jgi:CRISPR/Cas system-associated exonuclease Cas4 (RecB family)
LPFLHQSHDFPSLIREETETGERLYLTPDGKKYPSVTTVIADHNKAAIDKWKDRVGHAKAKKIADNASSRGDIVHLALEALLNNFSTAEIVKQMLPHAKAVYVNMKQEVERNLSVVHGLEQPLFSHKLRMAGTTDCIAVYDNLLSIVDFKTSLRLKKKEWVHGYFMQLTAYAFMFQEMTGLEIKQGVILIGVDGETEAQTFRLPRTEFSPYFKDLVSWRDKYEQREAA